MRRRKYYWHDVETTGLVAGVDIILEIYLAEADFYNPYDYKEVYHAVLPLPMRFDPNLTDRHGLDPKVVEMHTKNGLFEECRRSTTGLSRVTHELLQLIPPTNMDDPDERRTMPVLAGSVVSFDHGFMRAQMPEVAARFSHRHRDVSSKKLDCESKGMPPLPKALAHRVREDVAESVAHDQACDQWLAQYHRGLLPADQVKAAP